MLKTFDDIFIFFKEVCSIKDKKVTCGIWLSESEFILPLRHKVRDFLEQDENVVSIKNTSNHIFISFKTGSALEILSASNTCRGKRFFLSAYDNNINTDLIDTIIKPCAFADFYPIDFSMENIFYYKDKCNYCICKTCAVAQVNGGAPGCGDCKNCDLTDGCRSCNDYYNIEPIKNLNKENGE